MPKEATVAQHLLRLLLGYCQKDCATCVSVRVLDLKRGVNWMKKALHLVTLKSGLTLRLNAYFLSNSHHRVPVRWHHRETLGLGLTSPMSKRLGF